MKRPDLNCDLGEHESPAITLALMQCIDSANIACGGHAGDVDSMKGCIDLALDCNVHIGAHPGLADAGGRGDRFPSVQELINLLDEQVGAIHQIATARGASLHHIKLHGSLYHATDQNTELAMAYIDWAARHFPHCRLYARSGGLTAWIAEKMHHPFWNECFLDRSYESDGTLVKRGAPHALITDSTALEQRLHFWIENRALQSCSGEILSLPCETFCLHSDSVHSIEFAQISRKLLDQI